MKKLLSQLTYLLEMADKRKKAIEYLESQARPYTAHICKIILWGNQNERWLKDWSDEIFDYLDNVASVTVKGSKRLSYNDYLTFFFKGQLEDTWELRSKLVSAKNAGQKEDYPPISYVPDLQFLYSKYNAFVDAICPMVAENRLEYRQVILACSKYLVGE